MFSFLNQNGSVVDFDNITKDTNLTDDDMSFFIKNNKDYIAKFRKGAEAGNLKCQIFLSAVGIRLMEYRKENLSDEPDKIKEAYEFFERYTKLAAEQGDTNCQSNLAKFYLEIFLNQINRSSNEISVEKLSILRDAKFWYEKAAANGDINAQNALSNPHLFEGL